MLVHIDIVYAIIDGAEFNATFGLTEIHCNW